MLRILRHGERTQRMRIVPGEGAASRPRAEGSSCLVRAKSSISTVRVTVHGPTSIRRARSERSSWISTLRRARSARRPQPPPSSSSCSSTFDESSASPARDRYASIAAPRSLSHWGVQPPHATLGFSAALGVPAAQGQQKTRIPGGAMNGVGPILGCGGAPRTRRESVRATASMLGSVRPSRDGFSKRFERTAERCIGLHAGVS